MTTYKDWFISLGAAVLLVSSLRAETPALQFSLTPPSVQPGQRAVVEIRLDTRVLRDFEGDVDDIRVNDALLNSLQSLTLLSQSKKLEGATAIWRYEFTAYDSGEYTFPPLEFSYGASSFSSEGLSLSVASTRAEGDHELREGFDSTEIPWVWPEWLRTLIIITLLTAILTPVVWKLIQRIPRRRRVFAGPVVPNVPRESDADWLRRHLSVFREALKSRPNDPRLIDELTYIIRAYYTRKLNLPVKSMTTREFINRFAATDTSVATIISVFQRCDAVKFTNEAFVPHELATDCLTKVEQTLLCS